MRVAWRYQYLVLRLTAVMVTHDSQMYAEISRIQADYN